jgi:hypothetical protein
MIKFRLLRGTNERIIRYGNFTITLTLCEYDDDFETTYMDVEIKHSDGNVTHRTTDVFIISESHFNIYIERAQNILTELEETNNIDIITTNTIMEIMTTM